MQMMHHKTSEQHLTVAFNNSPQELSDWTPIYYVGGFMIWKIVPAKH